MRRQYWRIARGKILFTEGVKADGGIVFRPLYGTPVHILKRGLTSLKTYHEDISNDDGGCAGLGEGGNELAEPQAAIGVEGVPPAAAAGGLHPLGHLGLELGLELLEDGLRCLQVPGQSVHLHQRQRIDYK